MTDKQIKINGCDVSGCVNFRPDIDTSETSYINACSIGLWQRWYSNLEPNCTMSCNCEDNPNCYYKQFKRSEAQCETMFVTHTDLEKKVKDLEVRVHDLRQLRVLDSEARERLNKQIDKLSLENDLLKKRNKLEFDETLLQYSNTIEDLQEQLKDSVMQKCPQCGETYLNPVGTKLYEALIEIKELVQSDYCTEIGSCEFCAEIGNCLNRKILHKISECEGNNE